MKNRINAFFPSLPLFITILSLSIVQVATAQIPSNGLVGYWPFNGNANDESGNGNNGTVNGATLTTDRFGNANSAYSFLGGSKIILPNTLAFGESGAVTFSAWVNLNNVVFTPGNGNTIFDFSDGICVNCWGYRYTLIQDSNSFTFVKGGSQGGIGFGISTTQEIITDVWYHLVGVIGEGQALLYLNGELVALSSSNTLVTNIGNGAANSKVLGVATVDNNSNFLNGKLDDISIYNRALSAEEIFQLYTDQTSTVATPPCPTLATNLQTGLVGYWPFCGNANDESGNGNNGTVNGAVASLCPDRNGNINSAYNFQNALGGITVNSFDFPDENYSVSAWVNVTFDPAAISSKNIISHDWNNGGEMILFLNEPTSQSVNFDCKPNTGNALPAPVNSNEWNHFVLQRQGLIFRLYLNGVLIQEGIKSSAPLIPNNNLFFGGDPVGTQFSLFNGKLDDICIWNRALTPTEITQLYTDPSVTPPVACTPFLGEDQTVCAGTSVTLSASGSSLACPTLPSNLQNGLVGYWPFCGNANDASGNGNNGTVNGATLTTDRFGNANSAYSFDGNDFIEVIGSSQLNCNTAISISAWVQTNSNIGNKIIVSKERYTSGMSYMLAAESSDFGLMINNAPGGISCPECNLGTWGLNSVQSGSWQNLTGVWDGLTCKLYLNGNLISNSNGALPFNGTLLNSSLPLYIGKWMQELSSWGFRYFNGKIDDVSIHNRALSAPEIQQLYTLGQSTYSWSNGATTASVSVTPTQTTTYMCTVTDANGNACTDSVTVFVPQIEATDLTICAGESTTLSVSGINSTATPSTCPTLPSNLQTGLVGYWPFCGNADDASGNGNNGTVNGATLTTDRFGNANSAYSFDGNSSKIIVSNSPSLEMGLSNYSLSAWVKTNSQNVINGRIISKGSSGCITGYMMRTGWPNSSKLYTENAYNSNCFVSNSSIASINNNQWRLVVVTIDRNVGVKFYIDGVLDSEYSVSSLNNISNGQDLFFGYNNLTNSVEPFSGEIDDISIHNRALSPTEIQQLYTLGQTTYLWSNGETTPTINVSPTETTTYTCTVTTNGVSCTDSVTVVVNNPTIDLGSDVAACGTSTTLTAPTGYDSYAWSNGGTTNTTTVTANGTYTCTVTQGGCSASDSVDVTLIDATISATDSIICAGETTTLSVPQGGSSNTACAVLPTNLQNGLVGYWPFCGNANDASGNGNNGTVNGATLTTDRFGNANSAYSFDGVDDYIDCSNNLQLGITSGNSKTISFWFNPNLNCDGFVFSKYSHLNPSNSNYYLGYVGNSNGLTITGNGTNSYLNPSVINSNWSFISVIFDQSSKLYINGQLANQFEINLNGNVSTENFLIGKVSNLSSYFQGLIDEVTFYNRALTDAEIQQLYTLGQTTYLWSNGATTPTINVSPTETTTYTCTVTTNGVSCTDSVTVVVNNPTIDLGSDVTVCGTSTTLTAPSGYDSYTWSNGITTNSTTVTANGTYTCTVTQGGCSASDAVDVTLIDATISATDSIICAGETTTLSVPQGGSSNTACAALPTNLQNGLVGYWPFCGNANDASGNGNNGTVNGATLTTDRFGNANSAYGFDGVNDFIEVSNYSDTLFGLTISLWLQQNVSGHFIDFGSENLGGDNLFANRFDLNDFGSVGQVTCSFDYNYGTTSPGSFNPQIWNHIVATWDGTFMHVFVNNELISSALSSIHEIRIFQEDIKKFGSRYEPLGANQVHFGGLLDDILIYNRALNNSEIQQLYTLGQTTYLWSNGVTTPTINVSPSTTTTYTCTVTTNGVSCTDTITVVVGNPIASITPNGIVEICEGESISLTGNGGVSYLWNTDAPTQSITVNTEGVYTVTATDEYGCTDSESQLVKVNFLPNIGVNNATICPGQSATLTATGGVSYVWSPATGLSATTGSTITATPATSTLYTVTGTSANGCTNTAAAAVTVNALPTATITPATATTFCQGGSVVLNANTGTGLTYQWYNNASAISGATSSSYTANASGFYTVVVTNASTCSSTSTAVVVTTIANVDYFADADGDGFGDAGTLVSTCIQPQGYVTDNTDCDDNDASVNTAATEVCNHIDDDCSGTIDDGLVFNTYYADNDGDNFGDANNSIDECSQPSGYVTNNTDCNDNNANQNAASPEICNGEDDDCDGAIDNGLVFLDYYADLDSDGFGAGAPTNSCVDLGAGYVLDNTDCDDTNANVNTTVEEICNDIDDNCDGQIDEGITFTTYYQDFDNDGFGTGDAVTTCNNPGAGWVTNSTDCDDTNANVNTAVEEICNDIDDNCNNEIDEGLLVVYYLDNDGDSFGSVAVSILACTQPAGYTTDFTDCNDNDANINPSAEDIAGNGIDENCDGEIDNSIFELNASINLYPNPTRSELNIQISNALVGKDMYIFDAVGKLVYKQQLLSTQTTLSMSEYADGNYIFRVGEVVKRFEVMK